MMGASCPRCRGQVALHLGRPRITAGGTIELWCAACADAPAPAILASPAPPPHTIAIAREPVRAPHVLRPRAARRIAWAAGAGAVAAALMSRAMPSRAIAASAVVPQAAEVDPVDDAPPPAIAISHEDVRVRVHVAPAPDPTDVWTIPDDLDTRYPSLASWVHPVIESPQPTPTQESRWFGAPRVGIVPRAECGEGHCGVDLDGPRGRAVVAVADGTVVRVEHSELGRDHRSGRYVRIEHDDGTLTAYMHLDDITADLEVGDRVVAGEQLGTLGATACYRAAAHLHFSLALPDLPGTHGDNNDNHYIDPMPFLARASVLDAPTVPAKGLVPGTRPSAGS